MNMVAIPTQQAMAGPATGHRRMPILSWILRLAVAAILFQTLFFKFTGAAESVYIFSTLGIEPWGRIGTGLAELVACVMLLVPRTVIFGAGLSLAIMVGALGGHLTKLGIVVQDDGGLLFALAWIVTLCSLGLLFIHRFDIRRLLRRN